MGKLVQFTTKMQKPAQKPKFIIYKGGAGSGHYGHRGRPGKRGGSISGASGLSISREDAQARRAAKLAAAAGTPVQKQWIKTVDDKEAWVDERLGSFVGTKYVAAKWDAVTDGKVNTPFEDFAHSAYEYTDAQTGIHTKVTGVSTGQHAIEIYGSVHDADGAKIGEFTRTVQSTHSLNNSTGKLMIDNDYFNISGSARGSGFGKRFYENQEQVAKAVGIEAISLQANMSVGGYAWARMGYDFKDSSNRNLIADKVGMAYLQHTGQTQVQARPMLQKIFNMPAYEMAALEVGGVRIGKEAMLGTAWYGVKYLNDADPSYQAGQVYYNQ